MGSWNIIAIFPPRIFRSSLPESFVRSLPSKEISPPVIFAFSGSSRRIDMQLTLFPLPDSPTRPTISPSLTEKLTPRTAFTSP